MPKSEEGQDALTDTPPSASDNGTAASIRNALNQSVKMVIELNNNLKRADPIAAAIDMLVDDKMKKTPKPTGADDDPCSQTAPPPKIATLCAQLALGTRTADLTYGQAQNQAAGTLYGAVNTWELALFTYDSSIQGAEATLDGTIAGAIATYQNSLKANPDAISRSRYLWWVLRGAVVAAVTTYEAAVQAAANTLATAVGTLLVAYATYVSAIDAAEPTRLSAVCTAQQTFWQGVEAARDSS